MSTGEKAPRKPRRRSPIFVDRPEVREALGLSDNRALAKYVEQGRIPAPVRWLTPRRPVWNRKEWERWLRAGSSDQPAPGSPPAIQ